MSSKINDVENLQAISFLEVISTAPPLEVSHQTEVAEVSGTQQPQAGAIVQGLRNAQWSGELEAFTYAAMRAPC